MLEAGTPTPLWTAAAIAEVTGGAAGADFAVTGIAIDSRDVVPGDLFVALPGTLDGHDFIPMALQNGAAGVLVRRDFQGPVDHARAIRVDDTMAALVALGTAARNRMTGPVIAVTGSAGKTTVTQGLRAALGRDRLAHSSIRSFNNHVGVPLSLARMPAHAARGVFELGMNAPGEIRDLAKLARPDVAVITTIAPAHMRAFKDLNGVADAKAEIFEGLKPGGTAVLNRDIPQYERLKKAAKVAGVGKIVSFGFHKDADVRPVRCVESDLCSCVTASIGDQLLTFKIGIPGKQMVENALAILAATWAAGADLGLAGLALAEMRPLSGRGRRFHIDLKGAEITVIDDSYNANPASMAAALKTLGRTVPRWKGRRIAVLGDMAELGDNASAYHAALADAVKENAQLLVGVGPLMGALCDAVGTAVDNVHLPDQKAALDYLLRNVRPGAVVLVKGSRAARLDEIVTGFKRAGTMLVDAAE